MKKQIIFLSLITIGLSAVAQKEYKLAKSSGKLNLNISGVTVEGYTGNELIFSIPRAKHEVVDERAKGLKVINGSGFVDNTGLGLDVTIKGDDINVNPVSISGQQMVKVKVPQNIKVSFTNNSNTYQDSITLKNLKNEIEVSVNYNEVKLLNNTGPMNIKTLYGSVDAVFQDEIKGPVSIVSVYGHVDVALPASVKANIEAKTNYGKIYAAEGLKIAIDKAPVEKQANVGTSGFAVGTSTGTGLVTNFKSGVTVSTSGSAPRVINFSNFPMRKDAENIKGKINGGGIDLILKSNQDNIYLRQQ